MNAQELHEIALSVVSEYKRCEARIIDILQKIDHAKAYREFGCASLFEYATKLLKLSENVAYIFINVARKATQVPALKAAIENKEISVPMAKKITSVLTQENSKQWIEMAKSLPQQKLEKEVAKINPKAACRDQASYVSEHRLQLMMGISEELMEDFKRVKDLECQREQGAVDFEGTLKALVSFYLNHEDPLRKSPRRKEPAKKAQGRQVSRLVEEVNASSLEELPLGQMNPVLKSADRVLKQVLPLKPAERILKSVTPALKRQVFQRENLRTLCSAHHRVLHSDVVHQ